MLSPTSGQPPDESDYLQQLLGSLNRAVVVVTDSIDLGQVSTSFDSLRVLDERFAVLRGVLQSAATAAVLAQGLDSADTSAA